MAIQSATPQDTFDHVIGSGALSWEWWHACNTTGVDKSGNVSDDWSAEITADNGEGNEVRVTVNHAVIMRTARKIMADTPDAGNPLHTSSATRRECRNLIFSVDETDFDACTADELLQFAVLGEVIFG